MEPDGGGLAAAVGGVVGADGGDQPPRQGQGASRCRITKTCRPRRPRRGWLVRCSTLVADAQPGDVVGGGAFGVVGGLVAGVLLDTGDVEVVALAGPTGG